MARSLSASKRHIRNHWKVLCEEIGNRLRGTKNERRAAAYIEGRFENFGLQNVHQHHFEFPDWNFSRCSVKVGQGRRRRRVPTAVPMAYSVSTPARGVRGRLVYLEGGDRFNLDQETRGRVGLLIGSLSLGDPEVNRRLVRSGLAALLVVDVRNPYTWRIPAGGGPQWWDGYNIPTASISYYDAIALAREAERVPLKVEVAIRARTFPATSQNVIGEVIGAQRPDQVLIISAHYDCVWGNVGANDDASGTVLVLEMARLFAGRRPRRTIRFIAYGSEENLSVGAYLYMRSLTAKQRRGCILAMQAGSIAGHIGRDWMGVTGPPGLADFAHRCWRRRAHPIEVQHQIEPYGDQFPMAIAGVPAIWFGRPSVQPRNFWQHHSPHDHLANVSVEVAARTIDSTADFLNRLATTARLPYSPRIEGASMREVRKVGKALYRHPWSVQEFRYR